MSQYRRLAATFSDCSCEWKMGKKKGHAKSQAKSHAGSKIDPDRDSDAADSETSEMSGTSSEKRRLAHTREQLREAGQDALRMASAHEPPTQTPIYGPGNIFDTGDDGHDDEIATLRKANADLTRSHADLTRRLRKYHSEKTVGAASRLLMWKPQSLPAMPPHPPTVTKASDILAFRKFLFDALGYYSFPLRLGPQERKMLTPEMITTLEANEEEFRTTYTTPPSTTSSRIFTSP